MRRVRIPQRDAEGERARSAPGAKRVSKRTRVIGYVWTCTDGRGEQRLSAAAQRARLEAYAVAMELDLVAIREDHGSQIDSLDRPGLRSVLGHLAAGGAEGLLVVRLDRLTRVAAELKRLCLRHLSKAVLLSMDDGIDTRTAGGRLALLLIFSVALGEWDSSPGFRPGERGIRAGAAPLGWRRGRADEHARVAFVSVAEEASTVERIRELRAGGLSLRQICDALVQEGRRTKRGGRWAPQTIARVLSRVPHRLVPTPSPPMTSSDH